MDDDFVFVRQGRSHKTIAVLIVVYAVLISLVLLVDAVWWLMLVLALLTLPAVWDLATNPSAGVHLDDTQLRWHSGRRKAVVDLGEIDHMRFDTRWDFSVRVMVVLKTKKKIRLPFEALPPHRAFETVFLERDIPVKRHHFSIF